MKPPFFVRPAVLAASILPAACSTADKQPNILFIVADDYGWKDTGCTGSDYYETPNIDAIAADGMNFTCSYAACHVSSPTRATYMTGLYPDRHRITQWIGEKSGEEWRKKGRKTLMLPAPYDHDLAVDEFRCLPQILHDNGYTTFMAGKWHLGSETTPEKAGFDYNFGGYSAGHPLNGYFVPYKNPVLEDGPAGEDLSTRLGMETVKFLRSRRKSDAPFFIYLPFYAVHGPLQTTEELWQYFRAKADTIDFGDTPVMQLDGIFTEHKRQDNPVYAGLIKQMDDAIGEVLAELERRHMDRNTIIIFTSDNGGLSCGESYSTSNAPLRGGKGSEWEGGVRVPLIIRTPEFLRKGTAESRFRGSGCDTPVHAVDLFPTILSYAGIPVPESAEGVSLLPLLAGGEIDPRSFYWHYPHYSNRQGAPSSYIVNSDRWKLIHYYETDSDALYNLSEDPYEEHECLALYPETARKMRAELDARLAATGALKPVFDPLYSQEAHDEYISGWISRDAKGHLKRDAMLLDPSWQPNDDWWGSKVTNPD